MAIPVVPQYQLLHFCGKGAGGEVWIARGPDGRRRAVKLLPGSSDAELAAASCFQREFSRSPVLLTIFRCAETSRMKFYVMEPADNLSAVSGKYCPDTLGNRLRKHVFTHAEIMDTMRRIIAGTAELHRHGWAHRDLKPENILFVHGKLKIADPGLMCPLKKPSRAGTPGYCPVRCCAAEESDLYAIGKLLYRMFSGLSVEQYPKLPPDPLPVRELNIFALRCCGDIADRFRSIEEVQEALEKLK